MKKIICFASVFLLIASLSLGAFASETGANEGSYNIPITGSYQPGSGDSEVISADIVWGAMDFRYCAPSAGTWSPDTHGYVGATDGGWSTDKAEITVTNHSNTAIDATFTFAATGGTDITGTFYFKDKNGAYNALNSNVKKLMLASAEGTTVAEAPTGSIHFAITDGTIAENVPSLGNITVTIAKEHWTEVATEEELRAAIQNGGSIRLTSDISAVSVQGIDISNKIVKIDLNGHSLNTGNFSFIANSGSLVTLLNGTIFNLYCYGGTLLVENCAMSSVVNAYYHRSGNATFKGCTFNGYCAVHGPGSVELQGTTVFAPGSKLYNGENGITYSNGTVLCHFDPSSYIPSQYLDTCTVTNNGNGTWTISK